MILLKKHSKEMMDINKYTANKLKEMSESLETLSKTFSDGISRNEQLGHQEGQAAMQMAAAMVCGNCRGCSLSHQSDEEDNYYLYYVLHTFEKQGILGYEDMPQMFVETCKKKDQYLDYLNHNLGKAQANLTWKNRFLESREAVVTQFEELAGIMEEFARQMAEVKDVTPAVEGALRRALKLKRLKTGSVLVLEYGNHRQEAYLTVNSIGGRCVTAKEINEVLNRETGLRWQPALETKNVVYKRPVTLRYVEDTNYMILYGVSRAVKDSESVSGDNYTFSVASEGQVVMSLADGMGSGSRAAMESERVIELTQQLLETGFSSCAALKLVNSMLLLEDSEQHPTTLDLCCIDLYSGVLEAMKLGAVATFVIGRHGVEVLETENIPMGMLKNLEPVRLSKKLWDGDIVVMMTDGVLEAVPGTEKELHMSAFLETMEKKPPQEMAEMILNYAKSFEPAPSDDMSVMVSRIWEK